MTMGDFETLPQQVPPPAEIEQLWAEEAQRRFEAYKAGELEAQPGPEVHRRILNEIQ